MATSTITERGFISPNMSRVTSRGAAALRGIFDVLSSPPIGADPSVDTHAEAPLTRGLGVPQARAGDLWHDERTPDRAPYPDLGNPGRPDHPYAGTPSGRELCMATVVAATLAAHRLSGAAGGHPYTQVVEQVGREPLTHTLHRALHDPDHRRRRELGQRELDVQREADRQVGAVLDVGELVGPLGAGALVGALRRFVGVADPATLVELHPLGERGADADTQDGDADQVPGPEVTVGVDPSQQGRQLRQQNRIGHAVRPATAVHRRRARPDAHAPDLGGADAALPA